MLRLCQNWIFGQKFDFSNSVNDDDTSSIKKIQAHQFKHLAKKVLKRNPHLKFFEDKNTMRLNTKWKFFNFEEVSKKITKKFYFATFKMKIIWIFALKINQKV